MSGRSRRLAGLAAALVLAVPWSACGPGGAAGSAPAGRVIVLGFDGMDHELTRKLMGEGKMPAFSRLAARGSFSPLATSVPPQSPVAWSDFITGMDAGGHGIFDFVHRDPKTMLPYLSTSRATSPEPLCLGKWQLPLRGGTIELLRHGQPFWEVLEQRGVETAIVRMPANFPPSGVAHEELSGMGTPDLIGTYGTFSYYTSNAAPFAGKDIGGGKVYEVDTTGGIVEARLVGPDNPFLCKRQKVHADFRVYLDPVEPVAKLVVGEEERLLAAGEWSDWVPVRFPLAPTQDLKGMCRFYLRQVHPDFQLYASPINLDPMDPALPISTPDSYALRLAEATGRFYTQGMPEDTKALSEGVFDREEFLRQARIAGDEIADQYRYVLERFRGGLLFYYFGNLDQVSHMMWRTMDPGHPAYDAAVDAPFAGAVPALYQQFDAIVAHTLDRIDERTLLVVMSDHGFTSWRRSFHLNSWLRDNGYAVLKSPARRDDPGLFARVDWTRTRAYALGINGLYLNLRGRERHGVVSAGEKDALLDEIGAKLLATLDPQTGQPAVTRVYRSDRFYRDRGHLDVAPDLVVGYARGTRGSNESALGKFPAEVIVDNTDAWSGDHCMDNEAVPGILLTSRALSRPAHGLKDLAGSILAELGVTDPWPAGGPAPAP